MKTLMLYAILLPVLIISVPCQVPAQSLSREQWGAPLVKVSHGDGNWIIAGKKQIVTLNDTNLALRVRAGWAEWAMVPSGPNDMLIRYRGKAFAVRLADADKKAIVPYDTGYKTGIKLTLSDWREPSPSKDRTAGGLTLYLTVCLEGADEDLTFDIAADENSAWVRQLDWPTALDARDIDCTLLSNIRGVLLPRNWAKPYHPIRAANPDGTIKTDDVSEVQSNVIESWSMSWWGFQKGRAAMMVIVETPDDAAYQFNHPPGGPTVIGPRWRTSLGKLACVRSARCTGGLPWWNSQDMSSWTALPGRSELPLLTAQQ